MKTQFKLYQKLDEFRAYREHGPLYDTLAEARAAAGHAAETEWRSSRGDEGTYLLAEGIPGRDGVWSPWLISTEQVAENDAERIQLATDLALKYGWYDGGHHKQWVIDQMLRILLGDKYAETVALDPEDEDEYEPWDEGIAP